MGVRIRPMRAADLAAVSSIEKQITWSKRVGSLRKHLAAMLKAHLRVAKDWRLGIGEGFVDHPELAAVEAAFRSPWIPRDPVDARGVLLLMSLPEVSDWMTRAIVEDVDLRAPRADVLWGAFEDPAADRVRVSVLLGF